MVIYVENSKESTKNNLLEVIVITTRLKDTKLIYKSHHLIHQQ